MLETIIIKNTILFNLCTVLKKLINKYIINNYFKAEQILIT